jgi:hypothetical protein
MITKVLFFYSILLDHIVIKKLLGQNQSLNRQIQSRYSNNRMLITCLYKLNSERKYHDTIETWH